MNFHKLNLYSSKFHIKFYNAFLFKGNKNELARIEDMGESIKMVLEK